MADVDVTYEPISIASGPVTVTVQGLDNTSNSVTLATPQPLAFDSKVAVTQPIETDSTFTFSTPKPLATESKSELDVKPLAIDQCLRISLAPLPPTCIRFPTHQHIGFTLFGIEIVGLRFSGEAQVLICEPPKTPFVAWGDVTPAAASGEQVATSAPATDHLRIRLGD